MIDKIDESTIDLIVELSKKYERIHNEMQNISTQIDNLSRLRESVSSQLMKCREEECELINKIEVESGLKFTPDVIKIILDERNKG